MPKAFCPACLTTPHVRPKQLGHKVICPECGNKFVAVGPAPWRPHPIWVAVVLLFIAAVAIFWWYKATKPPHTAGPTPPAAVAQA